jgi:molecular chaperone GrpE
MRACRFSATNVARRAGMNLAAPFVARRWATEASAEGAKPEANGKTEAPKTEAPKAAAADKDVAERLAKVEKLLEEKTAEAKELKEKMLYAVADADNARRIAKLDIDKARDYSVTSIAKDMLDVVDTLARAVEAFQKLDKDTEHKASQVLTGVKMSHTVLLQNLARHGVEKMQVEKGMKFDPNMHDALFRAPITADVKADHIAAVVKDGYNIKGRVLRAAQVGVAESE